MPLLLVNKGKPRKLSNASLAYQSQKSPGRGGSSTGSLHRFPWEESPELPSAGVHAHPVPQHMLSCHCKSEV